MPLGSWENADGLHGDGEILNADGSLGVGEGHVGYETPVDLTSLSGLGMDRLSLLWLQELLLKVLGSSTCLGPSVLAIFLGAVSLLLYLMSI